MSVTLSRRFIAAIDQGTTSTRCIIFDNSGSPVSSSQREHPQIFPRPAWVEHDALDIWASVEVCVAKALVDAKLSPSDLAAVGITNQRETVVVWDRVTGRPLYNALVWQDQRGAPMCDAIASRLGGPDCFRHKTGLPVVPYFSATKLAWLLDHVTGLREAAEAGDALAGTIDAFLAWKLTGEHVTGELVSISPGEAPASPIPPPISLRRCDQCFSHSAVQHPHHGLGPRALRRLQSPLSHAAPSRAIQSRRRHVSLGLAPPWSTPGRCVLWVPLQSVHGYPWQVRALFE